MLVYDGIGVTIEYKLQPHLIRDYLDKDIM